MESTGTRLRQSLEMTLGGRKTARAVWDIDRRLAAIVNAFDFLLLVTPVNAAAAWRQFQWDNFRREPSFIYRPLPADLPELRRRLKEVPVHRIQDRHLGEIFERKRLELDRRISMLDQRGSSRFLRASLELYGPIPNGLWEQSQVLLDRLPPQSVDVAETLMGADEVAARARAEIAAYRKECAKVTARVQVRRDISGLLVSHGDLLVGASTKVSSRRIESLLQHEVGTHLLVYYNGGAQPLKLMRCGLPGYERSQEGLALVAEYLVGGLNRQRLRMLAARVLAVGLLVQGASFVETFAVLHQERGFDRRTAFWIAARVYRGGGLTKDIVYLQGLARLLDYLRCGGAIELLLLGKYSVEHVPMIAELAARSVLRPPLLRPRYLDAPAASARLARLRRGLSLLELATECHG